MLLITLERDSAACRVELDGHDISKCVRRIELLTDVGEITEVQLTLRDDVTIIGQAGRLILMRPEPGA